MVEYDSFCWRTAYCSFRRRIVSRAMGQRDTRLRFDQIQITLLGKTDQLTVQPRDYGCGTRLTHQQGHLTDTLAWIHVALGDNRSVRISDKDGKPAFHEDIVAGVRCPPAALASGRPQGESVAGAGRTRLNSP